MQNRKGEYFTKMIQNRTKKFEKESFK